VGRGKGGGEGTLHEIKGECPYTGKEGVYRHVRTKKKNGVSGGLIFPPKKGKRWTNLRGEF